jgi:excisionase family DNA binding protein
MRQRLPTKSICQPPPEGGCPPLALRLRAAAQALGVSERALWELARNNQIPVVRLGSGRRRSLLFPLDQLKEWLDRQVASQAPPISDQ